MFNFVEIFSLSTILYFSGIFLILFNNSEIDSYSFELRSKLTLLFSVVMYYAFISLQLLPEVITTLKFRVKKLLQEDSLNFNLVFLPNIFSYSLIVKKK